MIKKIKKDKVREDRILNEIIIDAFSDEEQSMCWYYYLEKTITFLFTARCELKRAISPLQVGDEVEPYAMAPEIECNHEMFVMMRWERDGLAIPLNQLTVTHGDDKTKEAVLDWHYWVNRGYSI